MSLSFYTQWKWSMHRWCHVCCRVCMDNLGTVELMDWTTTFRHNILHLSQQPAHSLIQQQMVNVTIFSIGTIRQHLRLWIFTKHKLRNSLTHTCIHRQTEHSCSRSLDSPGRSYVQLRLLWKIIHKTIWMSKAHCQFFGQSGHGMNEKWIVLIHSP